MTENDTLKMSLEKLKIQKSIANQKYREKKKLEETSNEKDILEDKKINNSIECQTDIPKEESDASSDWLWNTISGTGAMVLQTIIQTAITLTLPLFAMWILPKPQTQIMNTTMQSNTSSAQPSKQPTKDTQMQITSLSSL